MQQERRDGFLKTLFIIIGVIASVCAIAVVAYSLFRKYFQVTFDCGDDPAGTGPDDEDYFADDEDEPFEPICCCEEEEEEPVPEADAEPAPEGEGS